jgi:hypothetical protein
VGRSRMPIAWMRRPGGHRYVGEFRDGKPNGQGIFTTSNGHRYVGEFRDGKPNGQGTLTLTTSNGLYRYVGVYRTRFFGHKFELSGLLHSGFLPGDTCVVRTA